MNLHIYILSVVSGLYLKILWQLLKVGGGIQQVAVGIGKGVVTGDGSKVMTGIGDGVTSIGTGVLRGTESVVTGAADGVFSVGKGLFDGVASVGRGVGNAIQGKKPQRERKLPPRR